MSKFGEQIIFSQLLDRHGRVEVPRIQRDYAQGREAESEVREEFLAALHGALGLPIGDVKLPINLDFIYGSVEGTVNTRFLPLDGQQRLTTLFLLHWYTAWQDGCSADFKKLMCPDGSSRFSYSVRPSSAEFFDALVNFELGSLPEKGTKLSSLIRNQSWYFRYWRLDPTIQSILRMLDSIHEKFHDLKGGYARLTSVNNPAITFQLLDLENFGLSDDLYIKMNARGKPLTPFETFKAQFEKELEILFDGESRLIGGDRVSVSEFFSRRMDTAWADFFWAHRDLETNLYDEAVMNLFRVVILITRSSEHKSYVRDVLDLRDQNLKSTFTLFHSKGWIDREFASSLLLLFETWGGRGVDLMVQLPNGDYFNEVAIFEKAASRPTELSYSDIVQFVAYLSFLGTHGSEVDPGFFQEWMRVVFNLTTNTSYDRATDMQRSVAGIVGMVSNSSDVLRYFAATEKPTSGFSPQQVQEEKLKAELILEDGSWRALIERAEKHDYFKGQVEFLLDFCGAFERWKDDGNVSWSSRDHHTYQANFERYLDVAEQMFGMGGLIPQAQYRWERALLSVGDYLLPCGKQNVSFLVGNPTEQGSWKRLLRGSAQEISRRRKFLQQLWDQIFPDIGLAEQLDAIIDLGDEMELWRQCFIENPCAIRYCGSRVIRWNSNQEVYLLSKTQMNGAHAELFTYCLYDKLRSENLGPLRLMSYYSSNETGIEPGIRLDWDGDEEKCFELEWENGQFKLYRSLELQAVVPRFVPFLVERAGFKILNGNLLRFCKYSDIRQVIADLKEALLEYETSKK